MSSPILNYECGEPIKSQQLEIDFNPLTGTDDNEFILNKCIKFWKLLDDNPSIHHLKVFPKVDIETTMANNESRMTVHNQSNDFRNSDLDGIETIEREEKSVNNVFMTKLKMHYCDGGNGDYFDDRDTRDSSRGNLASLPKLRRVPKNKPNWKHERDLAMKNDSKSARLKQVAKKRDKVAKLCKNLAEWDTHHPKSMETIGHPSSLIQAEMQRT